VLVLVRHGETQANVDRLLLGRDDPPLTIRGHQQAIALAAALPAPDLLMSSPLQRARLTAAAFDVPVVVDERWVELDYGELDGRPISSMPATEWDRWRADCSLPLPGGESLRQVADRVGAACDELAERAAVGTVVVVTHVSPIKAALAWALGTGPEIAWRIFVEDASIARVDTSGPAPVIHSVNQHPTPGP
jgi:broad specificity phosphatase PhoE